MWQAIRASGIQLSYFDHKLSIGLSPDALTMFPQRIARELHTSLTNNTQRLSLVLEIPRTRLDQIQWDTTFPTFLALFPHREHLDLEFTAGVVSARTFSRAIDKLSVFYKLYSVALKGAFIQPSRFLALLKKLGNFRLLTLKSIYFVEDNDNDYDTGHGRLC